MRLPIYQIDAFADRPMSGNPAAIVLLPDDLPEWLPDTTMQAIAAENNQTTTAFLARRGEGFHLRWFTPTIEEEICGHATLATAALVFGRLAPEARKVAFNTRAGSLRVDRLADGTLEIDFPARPPGPVVPHPELLPALGGAAPVEILAARDYLLVYDDPAKVRAIAPDFAALARTDRHAVIVTAPGDGGFDCVSRFFAPGHGIDEDHATGAAHATVAPYWCARLGRNAIDAFQASRRGGYLRCTMRGDRVAFAGRCVFYLEGTISI
ncbi:MAG: PhzF family phenazine biosynthesis protein [Alphaproteobacteria bacterium]|nr:PhzF family phenazine biosynthesis protein [Alphaproteobacteria bacterium]